jgi:hypothetical protein
MGLAGGDHEGRGLARGEQDTEFAAQPAFEDAVAELSAMRSSWRAQAEYRLGSWV